MSISADTIKAAQAGELEAVGAVTEATDGMIKALAYKAASKAANGAGHAASLAEELESIGRVALWEAIGRWDSEHASGAKVETYLHDRIRGAITEGLQAEVNPGADQESLKRFVAWLPEAEGNLAKAEHMATTDPDTKRRLSPQRARAARMAFQGVRSLDAPVAEGMTLGETVEAVYGVPEDLVEAEDVNRVQRQARIALVHAFLGVLTPLRREVLKARTGFPEYPAGDTQVPSLAGDGTEFTGLSREATAKALGITPDSVRNTWSLAGAQFRDSFPLSVAYPARTR